MKLNKIMLMAFMAAATVFTGCKDENPFDAQSPDDQPQILKPYNESGTGSFTYKLENPDAHMLDSCVVTPSQYTTVRWYLDGQMVNEGKKIDMAFPAGSYALKIEATTTAGKSTHRTGSVVVSPYAEDPYSEEPAAGRHLVPGTEVQLEGQNLDKVTQIQFSKNLFPSVGEFVAATPTYQEAGLLKFEVPTLTDGTYYVHLFVADRGYGSGKAQIHNGAVALDGYKEFTPGAEWVITGVNLANVASVKVGETEITTVTATATSVTLTAPALAEGEYNLSMKNADGSAVLFVTNDGVVESVKTKVTTETVIFEGPKAIAWDAANTAVSKDVMATVPVGSTIFVYYTCWASGSAEFGGGDEYYALRITTPWWGDAKDLTCDLVPQVDGMNAQPNPFTFTYDARCKALVDERGSMSLVGYGLTINRITWK